MRPTHEIFSIWPLTWTTAATTENLSSWQRKVVQAMKREVITGPLDFTFKGFNLWSNGLMEVALDER